MFRTYRAVFRAPGSGGGNPARGVVGKTKTKKPNRQVEIKKGPPRPNRLAAAAIAWV